MDSLVPVQCLSSLRTYSEFMLFVQDFSGLDTTLIEFSDYISGPVSKEKVNPFPSFLIFTQFQRM